jgi:biopolymer transport protein ExbD
MQFVPERKGRGVIINVTSLIDVMFLLVIFFTVTSTFRNQPAIELSLPRSSTAQDVVVTPTVVYLTSEGDLFVNEELVARGDLLARLRQIHAATGEDRIVLRADQEASHGAVVELIDRIKESGFRRVNLAARPSDDGP